MVINLMRKEQEICNGIEWIDISAPTNAEMDELSNKYRLNHHMVRDCMEPEHLPKYEKSGEVHFLLLRFYAHIFDSRMATIQDMTNKIAVFYNSTFIITIHVSQTPFLDVIRNRYVVNGDCASVTDLLSRIAWHALDTYTEPANRLSEQLDFYEKQIMLKDSGAGHIEDLYMIKREISILNKILTLMYEPINHIYPAPGEEASIQDVRDELLKLQTLYGQVLEGANNLVNLAMSFSAQKTNDVVKLLTVFSVFFMPLTFISSIYGMNFRHMPELEKQWGYPALLLVMVIVTASIFFWFKRKKWL
jgi:magnesium transporter